MKKILPVLFFLFSLSTSAQQPTLLSLKVTGGNGSDIVLTPVTKTIDGGFIISYQTGSTFGPINSLCSITNPKMIFQKYNADASIIEWSKCYAKDGDSFLIYMFPQNDGTTIFGGEFTGTWGFYITKHDAFDNIVWSKSYSRGNGPLLYDMIATSDGGYIMVGDVYYTDTNFTVHNSGSLNADIGVIKLDSLGNKEWSKAIGGSGDDNGNKVVAGINCYYIVGNTLSYDSDCTGKHLNYDAYLAKLDKGGNIIWHHDLGGDGADDGRYACADGKGGIIIAATSSSSDGDVLHHINAGADNIWAVAVDSNNNIVWSNCYGGGGGEYPNSICMATDGSIWIAGVSYNKGGEVDTAYGNEDAWIVHTDSEGNYLNAKVLGSSKRDKSYMICPLSNGEVIAGGYYDDSNGLFSNSLYYGGFDDGFLAVFAPETQTKVSQLTNTENGINVFPNPAKDELRIMVTPGVSGKITITNTLGQIVYNGQVAPQNKFTEIETSGWGNGLYVVLWHGADGKTLSAKFMKN